MNIHPSIISCNFLDLRNEIHFIDQEYGRLHIDIEDGNYIPNITFGEKLCNIICAQSKSFISFHLMINHMEDWVKICSDCKVKLVFLHIDHLRYPSHIINQFMDVGIEVGIALNPNAELSENLYLENIKRVLIMTSEPDHHNQVFIPKISEKIKKYIMRGFEVWCDGGIKFHHIEFLGQLGVSEVVMGRAVFEKEREL